MLASFKQVGYTGSGSPCLFPLFMRACRCPELAPCSPCTRAAALTPAPCVCPSMYQHLPVPSRAFNLLQILSCQPCAPQGIEDPEVLEAFTKLQLGTDGAGNEAQGGAAASDEGDGEQQQAGAGGAGGGPGADLALPDLVAAVARLKEGILVLGLDAESLVVPGGKAGQGQQAAA